MCGRGMGPPAAAALTQDADSGPSHPALPSLEALALRGAYRLEDASLEQVLAAAPRLTHLELEHCSRLQGATLDALPRLLPSLRRGPPRLGPWSARGGGQPLRKAPCQGASHSCSGCRHTQLLPGHALTRPPRAGCWTSASAGASALRRCGVRWPRRPRCPRWRRWAWRGWQRWTTSCWPTSPWPCPACCTCASRAAGAPLLASAQARMLAACVQGCWAPPVHVV